MVVLVGLLVSGGAALVPLHAIETWVFSTAGFLTAEIVGEEVASSFIRRILLLGLPTSLLAGLLTRHIAAKLIRPIERLVGAAEQLSRGEEHVELPESSAHDEISALTQSYRQMMGRLDDRARRLEESRGQVEEANQRLRIQNEELQCLAEVLEQLSITDGLTKLHNHRFFQEHLRREMKRADRRSEPLSLILVDIDHFKRWNDRLGHAAGDQILRRVAEVMTRLIRESDLLARYGGEEFALIAPNTSYVGALQLAEKIRSTISDTRFVIAPPSERQALTVSVGVALYRSDQGALFNDADRALYSAKKLGRNCVVSAEDLDSRR
jgi:diguanylate cyclase (GGDEF)-like protein